jgi:ADP-ribose pyrophosphatase YjhB (NUDIX family)
MLIGMKRVFFKNNWLKRALISKKYEVASFSTGSKLGCDDETRMLPWRKKPYNGVEIDATEGLVDFAVDSSDFSAALYRTIEHLKAKKKHAVYLRIDMLHSHYIPVASTFGFRFHHAEGDVATLLMWLPEKLECKVPPFGTHHCGVGGAVVRGDDVLVVRERGKMNNWKLPGGYSNLGEDISTAAEREVWEETGLDVKFDSVLCFRNQRDVQFGRNDIYVICRMYLENESKAIIEIDEEIDDAMWMPLLEFKEQNRNHMLDKVVELLIARHPGMQETEIPSTVPWRQDYKLYHPSLSLPLS